MSTAIPRRRLFGLVAAAFAVPALAGDACKDGLPSVLQRRVNQGWAKSTGVLWGHPVHHRTIREVTPPAPDRTLKSINADVHTSAAPRRPYAIIYEWDGSFGRVRAPRPA